MAATGNEVPTLDQLKDYISFASDEDATAYFEASDEEASAETGKKVLTAAQLKSIAASLGGGGSSGDESVVLFEGSTIAVNVAEQGLYFSQSIAEFSRLEISIRGDDAMFHGYTETLSVDVSDGTGGYFIYQTIKTNVDFSLTIYVWSSNAQYLYIDNPDEWVLEMMYVTKVVGYK